jgi:hypothetical protein
MLAPFPMYVKVVGIVKTLGKVCSISVSFPIRLTADIQVVNSNQKVNKINLAVFKLWIPHIINILPTGNSI